MRWLLILLIPITAYAANGDETVSGVGFLILSAATLIYRYKRYRDTKMKDSIQAAIDTKPAIAAAIGGGAITFTATNIISLIGMCVGVAGLVVAFLQWSENKRRNDMLEEELQMKKEAHNATQAREKQKGNIGQYQNGNKSGEEKEPSCGNCNE